MHDPHILQTQLQHYAAGDLYPLHMPGHKRRFSPAPDLAYSWDMTEVEGVDDLHEAEGILQEAMQRTAKLHGAARTWYLINGSTGGLLAGIRALAPAGSRIIVARNCHKAVYHAIELGGLHPYWLVPPILDDWMVYGSIPPHFVENALCACPDASCVVLTSPTYEGVISNIAAIAQICHQHGVPLLVDEAHGAHLGLAQDWPHSAVQSGADLIVQSAHKTLPSLTQTALLHLGQGSLADPEQIERQLDIFETSSPSYPLMASLDGCTGLLAAKSTEYFKNWHQMLHSFDKAIQGLCQMRVLGHGALAGTPVSGMYCFDPGKIPIYTGNTQWSGAQLATLLRQRFGFETEMACGDLCLAMTSLCDDPRALLRFAQALCTLDEQAVPTGCTAAPTLPAPGPAQLTIAQAVLKPFVPCSFAQAQGRISAEYVWAYPPGIPLIAPGEQITPDLLCAASELKNRGTSLRHSHCKKPDCIAVLA